MGHLVAVLERYGLPAIKPPKRRQHRIRRRRLGYEPLEARRVLDALGLLPHVLVGTLPSHEPGSTADWAPGETTLSAMSQDSGGAWSDPVSVTVTVLNALPTLHALAVGPDPVTRPGEITLAAEGVSDPDGTVVLVEFYRGEISPATLLGAVTGDEEWLLSDISTAGWALGEHTLLARARDDDGAWGDPVSTTLTVQNAIPTINALAVSVDPVTRPTPITLTADGVMDPDGKVRRVEFYLGTVSDDTRLGTVEAEGPWVLAGVGTADWAAGEHTLLARAQDNDGEWSPAVTTTVTIENAAPVVAGLSVSPDPVTRPGALTLVATGVHDPDGHVVLVRFYREGEVLGEADGSYGWTWTGDTSGWTPGEHRLSAMARDDHGEWSQPVSVMVTVLNSIPIIHTLSASPDPVTRPGEIILIADGVYDPDGTVVRVEFYHGQVLLGVDDDGSDGWSWTVDTDGWTLGEHTFSARAVDNDECGQRAGQHHGDGAERDSGRGSLSAVPSTVVRPGEITLSATGVYDPDGTVARVEFYQDDLLLAVDEDGSDGWNWTVNTGGWTLGEHTFSARAVDDDQAVSEPVSTTVTVQNAIPVVGSLSAVPSTVVRPGAITLSAVGVHDPDGTVVLVEFYPGDLLLVSSKTAAMAGVGLAARRVGRWASIRCLRWPGQRWSLEPVGCRSWFASMPNWSRWISEWYRSSTTRARTLNVHNTGTGPLVVEGFDLDLPFAIRPVYDRAMAMTGSLHPERPVRLCSAISQPRTGAPGRFDDDRRCGRASDSDQRVGCERLAESRESVRHQRRRLCHTPGRVVLLLINEINRDQLYQSAAAPLPPRTAGRARTSVLLRSQRRRGLDAPTTSCR
jgi:hypothetical protein